MSHNNRKVTVEVAESNIEELHDAVTHCEQVGTMQAGGTRHATAPSSVRSQGGAAFSHTDAARSNRLDSPGDASPPGIQITRGSFSDHLLPLDSPSSTRDEPQRRVPAARTSKTTNVLRSPTRKQPPPAPAVAPTPPARISKNITGATSSILMPARSSSASTRPLRSSSPPKTRVKKEIESATRAPQSTENSTSLPEMTAIDLSVNPVDALVKKLRHQAGELTQVYEQMEQKDADLDTLRSEIKQLRMKAETHKAKQQTGGIASAPRSATKKKAIPPPSRLASRATGSFQQQSQALSVSHEHQYSEDTAAAVRRMEEALTELRQCHDELLEYCSSAPNKKDALTSADVTHEQQLYIRVLEEAVHLKASELSITGHEELLVVLAELRHTIYQQEQEVSDLQQQLNDTKSEHLECKTVRLELEDKLQRETITWEQDIAALRQREAALQRQLEDVQRLAHTEHIRFREERVAHDEQAKRIAALEKDLRTCTHELRQWETSRSDSWAKKESSMARQVQELKESLEAERAESVRTKEALRRSERQLDELRAMQDGLLQSIDGFVSKEDQHERRIKQLEAQVEPAEQLQREYEALQRSNGKLCQELTDLKSKRTEQEQSLLVLENITQVNNMIRDTVNGNAKTSEPNTDDQLEIARGDISQLDVWLQTLRSVQPSMTASIPWLSELVEDLSTSLAQLRRDLEVSKNECEQLRHSRSDLEQYLDSCTSELKRLQAEHLHSQTDLIQTQLDCQKLQIRVSTMEEEVRDAQAQSHLRATLAEQIFEQENLLRTQQQRLQNALEQNDDLMELEKHLADQLTAKELEVSQLQAQLCKYEQQQRELEELELELEKAANLAEQQNSWNQQLIVELEHLELSKAEQDQLVETFVTREEAFTTKFTTLFTQYMQFATANKLRLKEDYSIQNRQDNQALAAPPSVHDEALGSGDILQMLRVFPTLVEEYLASVMLGIQGANTNGQQAKRAGRGSQAARATSRALRNSTMVVDRDKRQPPKTAAQLHEPVGDEEDPLSKQLREIADAFSRFKMR